MSGSVDADQLLTRNSPYWEKCARHQNKQTTRFVAHLFLCDDCAQRLRHECFNDRPPLFEGLGVHGFCGLCNRSQDVLLRQWFLDPICLNVVLAYPKTFAASQAVHEFWKTRVNPTFPSLRLVETEVVQLEPFVPGRRNQNKKAEALRVLDFAVYDDSVNSDVPAFHIEMKTGPGSIDEMDEFQLDVNDSNDIARVCSSSAVPAYIFHVQVAEEYAPPTRHSVAVGMWWTDCFRLGENLRNIRPRRGEEDKNAGYYSAKAFLPMEDFLTELRDRRYLTLRDMLANQPLPIR
jgi:hypothetical protein